MQAVDNILDLIGDTPLIHLRDERIYAKAEYLNPGGSIKDRVALAMIEGAKRDGRLKDDAILVEPTSGNTGIGIALVGRLMGYAVKIVMPENMSVERKKLIVALGAELVLTPAEDSIQGAVDKVTELQAEDPRVFVCQQFENPDNPRVHYEYTAHELWRQMAGEVDCFVAGVGSGGTLQGVGSFLREHKPGVHIVAVEPKNASALLGHEPGLHQIQGIGDGFVPGGAGRVAGGRSGRSIRRRRDRDHAPVGPRPRTAGGHLLRGKRVGCPQADRHNPRKHRHGPARPRGALFQYRTHVDGPRTRRLIPAGHRIARGVHNHMQHGTRKRP